MTALGYTLAALLAVAIVTIQAMAQPAPLEPVRHSARVAYVIDGDTLALDGVEPRIRLWGVDAPERDQRGAQAATDALRAVAGQGVRVSYIEIDRDRYRRIVARVFLPDGQEINRTMIEGGTASEFCRYSKGFYGKC